MGITLPADPASRGVEAASAFRLQKRNVNNKKGQLLNMGKQALTSQLKANGVPTSKKDLVNMGQQAVVTQMAANGLPTTRQGLTDMAKTQGQDWAVKQMSSALTKAGLPASVEALLAQELKARMEKRKSARDRSFDDTPPEAPTQARPKLVLDPPVRSDSLSFDVVILTLLILR